MTGIGFLKQFFLAPFQTGAITASSRGLSKLITEAAELSKAEMVVEFGSGAGVFTERILQELPQGAKFFAMEINDSFAKATRLRCPSAIVHQDSAVNTQKYLREIGETHCDRIICGLPWASFNEKLQDDLLDTIVTILRKEGKFLTFAYYHGLILPSAQRFRKKLNSRFSSVTETQTIWWNLPPAFVYCAER